MSPHKVLLLVLFVTSLLASIGSAFSLSDGFGAPQGSLGLSGLNLPIYAKLTANDSYEITGIHTSFATCKGYLSRPLLVNATQPESSVYEGVASADAYGTFWIGGMYFPFCKFTTPMPVTRGQPFYLGLGINASSQGIYTSVSVGGNSTGNHFRWVETFGYGVVNSVYGQYVIGVALLNYSSPSTSVLYPFNVTQNNSYDNIVTTRVRTGFNSTGYIYNHAVSCDMVTTTFWDLLFAPPFNFTREKERGLSIIDFPVAPEELLTDGLSLPNISVVPRFYVSKQTSVGDTVTPSVAVHNSELTLRFKVKSGYPNSFALFVGPVVAGDITDALELTVNNNVLTIEEQPPGGTPKFVTNASITPNGTIKLVIDYIVQLDNNLLIKYYSRVITVNDVLYGRTDTRDFPMHYIGGVAFMTDLVYGDYSFNLYEIALRDVNNPYPPFSQFQNGQRTVVNGQPFTAEGDPVLFTSSAIIRPDYNNDFYVDCGYFEEGPHTQRHFIAPVDVDDDWHNHVDVVVFSSAKNRTELVNPDTGVVVCDIACSTAKLLGIDREGALFVWALLFTLLVCVPLAFVAPVLSAVLVPFLMLFWVIIGWVPVWVGVTFIVIAAFIVASFAVTRAKGGE